MRKLFFMALLLMGAFMAKAQNNLQFNRVFTITTDSISNCSSGCPDTILYRAFTVAPNKVLKIESINFVAGNYFLFLDGVQLSKVSTSYSNSFPIWLPAGNHSIYFATYISNASAAGNYSYLMSALEFNVVQ